MEMLTESAISFFLSLISIFFINPIAMKIGLVDIPNNRKKHKGQIPLVGGIGIFIGVFIVIVSFLPSSISVFSFLTSIFLIILMGGFDDRYDIRVSFRFGVQAISAVILMVGSGLYLEDLGNLFGSGNVHLGYFGILFTIVAIIGAINAFNMIDGIDGLAGILSIISFSSLLFLFGNNHGNWVILPITFIGGILAYLLFNLRWPIKKLPKIFLGDAGSMLIGLSIVWLLIIGTQSKNQVFNPGTALWVIAMPLMDMASTMTHRILRGRSPFSADRTHLHHLLMKKGLSSSQTLIVISIVAVGLSVIGICIEKLNITEGHSVSLFITIYIIYYTITSLFIRGSELAQDVNLENTQKT